MVPIKAKSLIPQVVENTGFTEEQVKTVIDFYYKRVRESLSNLKNHSLHLEKLGNFYVKTRMLNIMTEKYNVFNNALEKKTKGVKIEQLIRHNTAQLEHLTRIREQLENDKERKLIARQKQKEYVENKRSLEKQVENTEGSNISNNSESKVSTNSKPEASNL